MKGKRCRLNKPMAVALYNFYKFGTKTCKYPLLGSKITRDDIRFYFKAYEKNF